MYTHSAAHRIPPELFKRIIYHLAPVSLVETACWYHWTVDVLSKKQLKHHLALCSLVCRYWAKHCRAYIFEHLELRTSEDANILLQFSKTSTLGMSIQNYVVSVVLRVAVPSSPWVHLIVNTLPRGAFPKLKGYTFMISGEQPASDSTQPKTALPAPRSIFYGLPRSLPQTRRAVSLTLASMHFASFTHLVTFLDSLVATKPPLRSGEMDLSDVSWADDAALRPSETPSVFRGARRRWQERFPTVLARRCIASWPLVWLLVAAERPRPSPNHLPPFVQPADLHSFLALVKLVIDDCPCFICEVQRDKGASMTSDYPLAGTADPTVRVWNGAHSLACWASSDGLATRVELRLVEPHALGHVLADRPRPEALAINWAALDQQATAFVLDTQAFSVRVHAALYAEYEPYVRARMPTAAASARLAIVRDGTAATKD